MTNDNITDNSKKLFISLANDAGNWNGTPILDITKEERGNLTQLKRAKLITTFDDDGCQFAMFTVNGYNLACELSESYRSCYGDDPERAYLEKTGDFVPDAERVPLPEPFNKAVQI